MSDETAGNAQGTESYIIHFDCWSCRADISIDLMQSQQERLDIDYSLIRPNPNDPQQYYLKCPKCTKFNAVVL